eukprot:3268959-Prymnesium_polylepis.1
MAFWIMLKLLAAIRGPAQRMEPGRDIGAQAAHSAVWRAARHDAIQLDDSCSGGRHSTRRREAHACRGAGRHGERGTNRRGAVGDGHGDRAEPRKLHARPAQADRLHAQQVAHDHAVGPGAPGVRPREVGLDAAQPRLHRCRRALRNHPDPRARAARGEHLKRVVRRLGRAPADRVQPLEQPEARHTRALHPLRAQRVRDGKTHPGLGELVHSARHRREERRVHRGVLDAAPVHEHPGAAVVPAHLLHASRARRGGGRRHGRRSRPCGGGSRPRPVQALQKAASAPSRPGAARKGQKRKRAADFIDISQD